MNMLGYLLAIACGILWGVSTFLMKIYSPNNQKFNEEKIQDNKSSKNSFDLSLTFSDQSRKHFKRSSKLLSKKTLNTEPCFANNKRALAKDSQSSGLISDSFAFLASLTSNWKFICSFLLNQLGSLLYTISLHYNPITISVPICNSISLALIVFLDCFTNNLRATPQTFIRQYVDIDFVGWLVWLFTPLLVVIFLPFLIILLIYMSALIAFIYKHRNRLDLTKILNEIEHKRYWNGALHAIAVMWEAHGYIWHSYEVQGLENIPNTGPALLIYYHGAIPIDYYYLNAKVILYKNRLMHSVGDNFLFRIPGWANLMAILKVMPGTITTCCNSLAEGNLLAISPGGVREAQFGTPSYDLVWGSRVGFAKVALQANVPVIPVFTQNVREAFRTVQFGKQFFRYVYDKFRIPLMLIYGGFPVKLKTIVGEPIYFDPGTSPQEVSEKMAAILEMMILKNQRIPGSIFKAILDRFYRRADFKNC